MSYDSTIPTELCSIMQKYGSDKGHSQNKGWHNYTTLYSSLFTPIRNKEINIFELGLGTNNTDVPTNMGGPMEYPVLRCVDGVNISLTRTYTVQILISVFFLQMTESIPPIAIKRTLMRLRACGRLCR